MPITAPPASVRDLCQELNVSYRQLDYWCCNGYLQVKSNGSGYHRSFNDIDRKVLRVVARLRDIGCEGNALLAASRSLYHSLGNSIRARYMVVRPTGLVIRKTGNGRAHSGAVVTFSDRLPTLKSAAWVVPVMEVW